MTYPRRNEPVQGECIFCHRSPRDGEVYGPHEDDWDFTNVCPECWDDNFYEDDDS